MWSRCTKANISRSTSSCASVTMSSKRQSGRATSPLSNLLHMLLLRVRCVSSRIPVVIVFYECRLPVRSVYCDVCVACVLLCLFILLETYGFFHRCEGSWLHCAQVCQSLHQRTSFVYYLMNVDGERTCFYKKITLRDSIESAMLIIRRLVTGHFRI